MSIFTDIYFTKGIDNEKKAEKEPQKKIIPIRIDNKPRIYATYVEINSNMVDLSLKFCDLVAPNKEEAERIKKEGRVEIPVLTEAVIPISLAKEILNILTDQLENIEKMGKEGVK